MSKRETKTPEWQSKSDRQRFLHDIQHSLHVIHLGLEVLKDVRSDEERFAEVLEMIDKERKQATELAKQLSEALKEPE